MFPFTQAIQSLFTPFQHTMENTWQSGLNKEMLSLLYTSLGLINPQCWVMAVAKKQLIIVTTQSLTLLSHKPSVSVTLAYLLTRLKSQTDKQDSFIWCSMHPFKKMIVFNYRRCSMQARAIQVLITVVIFSKTRCTPWSWNHMQKAQWYLNW